MTVTYRGAVEGRFSVAGAPFQLADLRPVPALPAQGPEPVIFIDGVRMDVDRTEGLSGTIDWGGSASGTFSATRQESPR